MLESCYETILKSVGEDPRREGLVKTPFRAAKAIAELTRGYGENLEVLINGAVYESDNDEMVVLKNIEFYSLCEHHLLPFFGRCHVGYLPNKKVIGVSKIARIADHFARRLQIQENLTKQIADCLMEVVEARGVGVVLEAQHFCMMMRGVEKQTSVMKTSMMKGLFRTDEKTRAEFLTLIK